MSEALILLIAAAVKSAITEIMVWSKDKTEDEIEARKTKEENRTATLLDRMRNP